MIARPGAGENDWRRKKRNFCSGSISTSIGARRSPLWAQRRGTPPPPQSFCQASHRFDAGRTRAKRNLGFEGPKYYRHEGVISSIAKKGRYIFFKAASHPLMFGFR